MLSKIASADSCSMEHAPGLRAECLDDWLPKIPVSDVASLNALYRYRRPIATVICGHAVTIETAAASAHLDLSAYWFVASVSGRAALLRVSREFFELCVQTVGAAASDRFGPVQAALLLELASVDSIKMLEARLQVRIRIEKQLVAASAVEGLIPFSLLVRDLPIGDTAIELHLGRSDASIVARALDEVATSNSVTDSLFIPIQICCGSADLTLRDLRLLRVGDIVLPDRATEKTGGIIALVGSQMTCQVHPAERGFRIVSNLTSSSSDQPGEWFMQPSTDSSQRPPLDESALEQLPIRVVFELGRLDVPLAEIRRLAPGYVFPLTKPTETAVDIVANGRKIGHGSLLKIGESVGVRIERLASDE